MSIEHHADRRVQFDFEITFANGGGLQLWRQHRPARGASSVHVWRLESSRRRQFGEPR